MPIEKIQNYLEEQNVKYKVIRHKRAYTAQEIAAAARIPGKQLAKTVMVKIDGKMAMAVLPASRRVDFEALLRATGAKSVQLATEKEFKDLFPECDVGAMPPFGHLYGLDVYVADSLSGEMVISFCAGTHTELVEISYEDFARLVGPRVIPFAWKP